jgi:hypothetical protein
VGHGLANYDFKWTNGAVLVTVGGSSAAISSRSRCQFLSSLRLLNVQFKWNCRLSPVMLGTWAKFVSQLLSSLQVCQVPFSCWQKLVRSSLSVNASGSSRTRAHNTGQCLNSGISVFSTYETAIPVLILAFQKQTVRYNSRKGSRLVVASYLGDKYVMTRRHTLLLQNCLANRKIFLDFYHITSSEIIR